ncbi:hypothetical protein IWW51_005504, partial [Coemansia sp. RSA 2702]
MGAKADERNQKLVRIRTAATGTAPPADIIMMQELKREQDPTADLATFYREFHAFVAPASAGQQHDVALLVRRRFPPCEMQTEHSTAQRLLVTIPSLGILLVAIHAPSMPGPPRNNFYQDLTPLLAAYQSAGWYIIIGGDFNIAPFPWDRIGREQSSLDRLHVQLLRESLNLVDVADRQSPREQGITAPRSELFTFRTSTTGNAISRIDYFLVDERLTREPGTAATRMFFGDTETANFDHAMIHLHIPVAAALAPTGKAGYRLNVQRLRNPDFIAHVNKLFEDAALPAADRPLESDARNPCDIMADVYARIHKFCKDSDRRREKSALRRIAELHKQFTELSKSSFDGRFGRSREERLAQREHVEREALALIQQVSWGARAKAARVWLKHADRLSEWFIAITRKNIRPLMNFQIGELLHHADPERVASDPEEVREFAREFYED